MTRAFDVSIAAAVAVASFAIVARWARRQPIGTRSVLYGAHCFALHWLFVAWGWWQLYGFRGVPIGTTRRVRRLPGGVATIVTVSRATSLLDPRLWVAFIVHDLGYLGKPNMDGAEGELHPYWGATLMGELFGADWFRFCLLHSRFLAKQLGETPSPLCLADKLAIVLTPAWLYLPMVNWTGEIREYMAKSSAMNATGDKYSGMNLDVTSQRAWMADCKAYVRRWVDAHKDGRADTWTPNTKDVRTPVTPTGVCQ